LGQLRPNVALGATGSKAPIPDLLVLAPEWEGSTPKPPWNHADKPAARVVTRGFLW